MNYPKICDFEPWTSCALCGAQADLGEPVCRACGALSPSVVMSSVRMVIESESDEGVNRKRSIWYQRGAMDCDDCIPPKNTHIDKPEVLIYQAQSLNSPDKYRYIWSTITSDTMRAEQGESDHSKFTIKGWLFDGYGWLPCTACVAIVLLWALSIIAIK